MDDMLIIGSSPNMIKSTKQMLNKRFDIKDMGVADVILGMKITKTFDGYCRRHRTPREDDTCSVRFGLTTVRTPKSSRF